jgi:hypothetical protein
MGATNIPVAEVRTPPNVTITGNVYINSPVICRHHERHNHSNDGFRRYPDLDTKLCNVIGRTTNVPCRWPVNQCPHHRRSRESVPMPPPTPLRSQNVRPPVPLTTTHPVRSPVRNQRRPTLPPTTPIRVALCNATTVRGTPCKCRAHTCPYHRKEETK